MALIVVTVPELARLPQSLDIPDQETAHVSLYDRHGRLISKTYLNDWNMDDMVFLHQIPQTLKDAFVISEDKRFFSHSGVDFIAKTSVIFRSLIQGKGGIRGASTITEQTIRLLIPRPRTVWSKWLEAVDAYRLEQLFKKEEILEFYLNQVPYASNKRGVQQAALHYFNRDLSTLSRKEMLALAVLVRAPSRYDLYEKKTGINIEGAINRLARRMKEAGKLDGIPSQELRLMSSKVDIEAPHFSTHVKSLVKEHSGKGYRITTTLDGPLHKEAGKILHNGLKALKGKNVNDGAVLIADHKKGEILAWVNDGSNRNSDIDAVLTPRQPGSLLKPFLYAKAVEKGWTAATLLEDSPLTLAAGNNGTHRFKNYSQTHHGWITVREALGNSLNIPAIRTVEFVGTDNFLAFLHSIGLSSLDRPAAFYGDGLALGNGEVTLYEIVRAYNMLANAGIYRELSFEEGQFKHAPEKEILSPSIASIISSILSDPTARQLEFSGSFMNFPVQTAIKTGTSSNYHDAWAVGYNYRYTVGIWLGNLDFKPTMEVTGATGAVPLLRDIFSLLNRKGKTRPFTPAPELVRARACLDTSCSRIREEIFLPGTEPISPFALMMQASMKLVMPLDGMKAAIDPRIPKDLQFIRFAVSGNIEGAQVSWKVDGKKYVVTKKDFYNWPMEKGEHIVMVTVTRDGEILLEDKATFSVR